MKEHDMTFEGLINQFISAITSEDAAEMAAIMTHAQIAEFMGGALRMNNVIQLLRWQNASEE